MAHLLQSTWCTEDICFLPVFQNAEKPKKLLSLPVHSEVYWVRPCWDLAGDLRSCYHSLSRGWVSVRPSSHTPYTRHGSWPQEWQESWVSRRIVGSGQETLSGQQGTWDEFCSSLLDGHCCCYCCHSIPGFDLEEGAIVMLYPEK